MATCSGVSPLLSTFMTAEEGTRACVRQVPNCVFLGITQSPGDRSAEVDETTSRAPSLPGTTEGADVPRSVSKVGLAP